MRKKNAVDSVTYSTCTSGPHCIIHNIEKNLQWSTSTKTYVKSECVRSAWSSELLDNSTSTTLQWNMIGICCWFIAYMTLSPRCRQRLYRKHCWLDCSSGSNLCTSNLSWEHLFIFLAALFGGQPAGATLTNGLVKGPIEPTAVVRVGWTGHGFDLCTCRVALFDFKTIS